MSQPAPTGSSNMCDTTRALSATGTGFRSTTVGTGRLKLQPWPGRPRGRGGQPRQGRPGGTASRARHGGSCRTDTGAFQTGSCAKAVVSVTIVPNSLRIFCE